MTNYFLFNLTVADLMMASLNCLPSFIFMRDRYSLNYLPSFIFMRDRYSLNCLPSFIFMSDR